MNVDTPSVEQALTTLKARLDVEGENATVVVERLTPLIRKLVTPAGRFRALSALWPYAENVPLLVEIAVETSKDDDVSTRNFALRLLLGLLNNSVVRARILELIDDPDAEIRNLVLDAISRMNFTGTGSNAQSTLRVIPEEGERDAALELLDELERAVKTLQDLGLDEGQDQIVDELILPRITELKSLLGTAVGEAEVVQARKRSLIDIGRIVGSAQGLALSTATLANAVPAAQTVKNTAEALLPVAKTIAGFLH